MTELAYNSLQEWIVLYQLNAVVDKVNGSFKIEEVGRFLIIEPKDNNILWQDGTSLSLTLDEQDIVKIDDTVDYFAFQFGEKWYYGQDPEKIAELKPLMYLGKIMSKEEAFPFLGIHGGFDICNGSRQYSDWCKKAKFLNISTIGIAEENTLAGVLAFQNACGKADVHSIIGETVTVKGGDGLTYNIKFYVVNEIGWKNLMLINSKLNVDNSKFIDEHDLALYYEGLICILTPEVILDEKYEFFKGVQYEHLLYQLDISKWDSDEKDKEWLLNIQNYLEKYLNKIPHVLINDAYYLEKGHAKIRKRLNAIGKSAFRNQSSDQHFKSPDEIITQFRSLFDTEDIANELIITGIQNLKVITENEFKIFNPKLSLPAYVMSEEESVKYTDNKDFFWSLIAQGLEEKGIEGKENLDEYMDRIDEETGVILEAQLQDYFLITWDILTWCDKNKIRRGYGRGSVAGSLIAYLLGISKIDPLEYGLLFSRFLNSGRLIKKKKVHGWEVTDDDGGVSEWDKYPYDAEAMGFKIVEKEIEIKVAGSFPDIDNDISGARREEVKRYIEERYGKHRVAGIGTYGAFKIKGAINALAKDYGADLTMTRYATGAINEDDLSWTDLFAYSNKAGVVKNYIQDNPKLIEELPLVLDQPHTESSHAAGVIIVPESQYGIFDQVPVKLMKGIVISEWEMGDIEQVGVLKIDVLGLKQLDKFDAIIQLIEDNTGDEIILEEIPLSDPKVYGLFGGGHNEDVFQFGGGGLKNYTQKLKPEYINDLIATVALYRPGPIQTGAHNQYIGRKNGTEDIKNYFGCENILSETYGVLCYQEQIMKMTQELASFTLNEADDIRKAIGKKDAKLMRSYKERFIEGAKSNGCPPDEAETIWKQIEVFGEYSFNKSHAACYAITGYHCQWLKANYPLEFWTVSLKYSKEEQLPNRLSEIRATTDIRLSPPDINKSGLNFISSKEENSIYWTITSISQVGPEAINAILKEREENGEFFNLLEFVKRMKVYSKAVKKNTIVNLIYSGAFDSLHHISDGFENKRWNILNEYFEYRGEKMDDIMLQMKNKRSFDWVIKQKELSGFGALDFRTIIKGTKLAKHLSKYLEHGDVLNLDLQEDSKDFRPVLIAGIVHKWTEPVTRENKDGQEYSFMRMETFDGAMLSIMFGDEALKMHTEVTLNLKDRIFIMYGYAANYKGKIGINTYKGNTEVVII